MLQVYFQIRVNLSILIIFSHLISILIFKTSKQGEGLITPFTLTNFKNIQTRWRGTIPPYSPPLYSPSSLNFQTGHKFFAEKENLKFILLTLQIISNEPLKERLTLKGTKQEQTETGIQINQNKMT